ncbi:unnamed protein product [Soboliphyme baturini]|uniref:Ovule protein n=1 Tax=Soboliphyme baturini TaxID=241478 RepID=A0A183IGU4_9BILA|nr:unnamed protein product [Soboliphyme baturini]
MHSSMLKNVFIMDNSLFGQNNKFMPLLLRLLRPFLPVMPFHITVTLPLTGFHFILSATLGSTKQQHRPGSRDVMSIPQ